MGYIAALFAALLVFVPVAAARAGEPERELQGLKERIERERQGMSAVRKKEGSVLQALDKIGRQLDRRNQDLKRISRRLETLAADLQKKEEETEGVNASLDARREFLRRRARAYYRWLRGGSPFVVFNGALSLGQLMQRKHYLEITLAHDRQMMNQLTKESGRLSALKEELAAKRASLDAERRALVEVKESIRVEREKKREILASLQREKETHARVLKELEQAAHKLQRMMDDISRRAVAKALPPGGPFDRLRGRLEYPVRGEIASGFGKSTHPQYRSEIFRKGIDIDAPFGEEIKSVGDGEVIFANRFSGYGNMVIIDHGQRYYTVYAHLSELLKGAGEAVQRGEVIARVGDSDSLGGARLYFEIRKDGKPVDPLPWFRK